MSDRPRLRDRAAGALWGLALGDALGMPTQLLSRREIADRYGVLSGFERPGDDHRLAAGLEAGRVTDDTEQAVLLAEVLSPGAHLDQAAWADALTTWEEQMRARGSLDLLGPSTRAALAALRADTPAAEAGRAGATNGAAMRVTPVGIAVPPDDLGRLVDRVVEASLLTHHTSVALAGAAAVAAAVSLGVAGEATFDEQADVAVRAAALASQHGHWVAGADVARRLRWAVERVQDVPVDDLLDVVEAEIGTSLATQESVPAAFAIASRFADPWQALCHAASVGGDCDTIAAMTGAIVGSRCGRSGLPVGAIEQVQSVNGLDLDRLADRLVGLRCDFS